MSDQIYACDQCDKTYKTRAGLWKHKKAKHSGKIIEGDADSGSSDDPSTLTASPDPTPDRMHVNAPDQDTPSLEGESSMSGSDQSPSSDPKPSGDTQDPVWMDFDFSKDEDNTDTIPTTFKAMVKPVELSRGKMSKAQASALRSQNKAILKMGLTSIDHVLTKYGQAATLDPDWTVKHSDQDKETVSEAQVVWMEEKGFFLTNYLSSGMIAGSLTAWYVGAPIIRIQKKSKKKIFRSRGILARLPLIGRIFRRKQVQDNGIAQNTDQVINVE